MALKVKNLKKISKIYRRNKELETLQATTIPALTMPSVYECILIIYIFIGALLGTLAPQLIHDLALK